MVGAILAVIKKMEISFKINKKNVEIDADFKKIHWIIKHILILRNSLSESFKMLIIQCKHLKTPKKWHHHAISPSRQYI